jgi:hypothetical protein
VLMSIPIISPVEVRLAEPGVRRLPAPPDYEVDALPAATLAAELPSDPATTALDDIQRAARISEYHDFAWWEERISLIRAGLDRGDEETP